MTDQPDTVEAFERLDAELVAAVHRLLDRATEADGVRPLSEHVMLHLRYGGDTPARNLLLRRGEAVLGYAHLDVTDPVEGASAEVVVDPDHRRRGLGRRLVTAVREQSPEGRVRLWAHGDHPGAHALSRSLGYTRVRDLWQMRRSLSAPLPAPTWPQGVTVRTFAPGRDEDDWVALNALAFADHPEQGGLTRADLDQRMRESWFDPKGFFLAEKDGRLVGFHWTKVHGGNFAHDHGVGAGEGMGHGHDPIGEVYVVGVDPAVHGGGLGAALTLTGLRHLRSLGLPQVMLYVDAENSPAIRVYERLGFTRWDTDVMYLHG